MILLIVDTSGIQSYVFGSNRLRENYGASQLVAEATEQWAMAQVCAVTERHNIMDNGELDPTRHIGDQALNLDAEVVYPGGGNFVVLFREKKKAREFSCQLSRQVLQEAPNLQLVIAQHEFTWEGNEQSLLSARDEAFKMLWRQKQARPLSVPLLGLGVTVMCRSTGWPAVEMTEPIGGDPGYPAAAEIHQKIAATSRADDRLCDTIMSSPAGYDYPRKFEDLGGTKGEHSYIAVVHADGNGMGERIRQVGEQAKDNLDYIERIRVFTEAVEAAATEALRTALGKVKIDGGKVAHPTLQNLEIELARDKATGNLFFPFRPLVFGGDDLTFVCDGRLGLSLTIEYLRHFEAETSRRPDCLGRITACAGIAITKSHYPFARAYKLAESLCHAAKNYRRRQRLDDSCLDWHFALSGLSGGIDEIRRREYRVAAGSLTLRPVSLGPNRMEPHRTWEAVNAGITAFQGEPWVGRRNKVKALRDALREGTEAVTQFLTRFNENELMPLVSEAMTDWQRKGWQGGYCGYFDAIELADSFIPLAGGRSDGTRTAPEAH